MEQLLKKVSTLEKMYKLSFKEACAAVLWLEGADEQTINCIVPIMGIIPVLSKEIKSI